MRVIAMTRKRVGNLWVYPGLAENYFFLERADNGIVPNVYKLGHTVCKNFGGRHHRTDVQKSPIWGKTPYRSRKQFIQLFLENELKSGDPAAVQFIEDGRWVLSVNDGMLSSTFGYHVDHPRMLNRKSASELPFCQSGPC